MFVPTVANVFSAFFFEAKYFFIMTLDDAFCTTIADFDCVAIKELVKPMFRKMFVNQV